MRSVRSKASTLLLIIGAVFGVIGVGFVIAAVATAISSLNFQTGAEQATGKIVAVDSHESCDTRERNGRRVRECDTVYDSTIVFSTADGQKITFESSVSSSNRPQVGDAVDVLYQPDDPQDARTGGAGVWLLPIVFGSIGLPFTVVGVVLIGVYLRRRRRLNWLQTSGRRVQAQIRGVDRNRRLRINNVNPWQIHVGWHDPMSGASYEFTSDNLMSDPTPALAGAQTIDVLIDPDDPQKRHWVDLTAYGLT